MVELEKKPVRVSKQFDLDIVNIFEYGEETFGYNATKIFIGEIYNFVWSLDGMYLIHPECRHIPSKSRMYRNIILGSYLIIYRITPTQVEVLKAISSRMSPTKIRTARSVKL
jgi:plasmid stabilization system protein ParE